VYVNQGFGTNTAGLAAPSRYGVAPAAFLLAALAISADRLLAAPRRWGRLAVAIAVMAAMVVVPLASFRLVTQRSSGPAWGPGVAAAALACQAQGSGTAKVPIAPPGWVAPLPCGSV